MWTFIKHLLLGPARNNTKRSELDMLFQEHQRHRMITGESSKQYEEHLKVVRKRDGIQKQS